MTKSDLLIGVDLGTTSIKGILMETSGEILATAKEDYSLSYPGKDRCEMDPEVYWEHTVIVIRELTSHADPENIKGISFSSQGETIIPVGKSGRAIGNAIVWMDNRSQEEVHLIKSEFGAQRIHAISGQPEVLPIWPATRILWWQRNRPDLFGMISKYLLVEDYIIFRFTGQYVSEQSLVSSTLYYDIRKKIWWDDMLDLLRIKPHHLPDVVIPGTDIGNITNEAAIACGLTEHTRIVAGAYDHPAGALGAGNIRGGMVSETTGTAMAMVVTLDEPVENPNLHLPLQIHAIKDKYMLLPYGQTAGMVLKWFRDAFFMEMKHNSGDDLYQLMTSDAEKIPPGSGGLIILPHLMGSGSPEFNSLSKGVVAGITPETTRAHFIRAILESVGYMILRNLEVLRDQKIPVHEIISLGGGAKSTLWNQIKADITELKIKTARSQHTGSIGAAILAGVGTGIYTTIEEGVECVVKADRTFLPDSTHFDIYRRNYRKYKTLSDLLEKYW